MPKTNFMSNLSKMKLSITLAFLLLGVSAISALQDINDIFSYKEGDRYFVTYGKDGNLEVVDLELTDLAPRFNADSDTVFRVYTRSNRNNPQVIQYNNAGSLTNSNYDRNKATKVIAHGWNNNGFSDVCTLVKDKFLDNLDVNVICVDWGAGASALYPTSAGYVPQVGSITGKFIDWLIGQGSSLGNFHIMGHSLGGHIAGIAGRSMTRGKVSYITAFDPAFPLWGAGSQRIRPSDGNYVEIIHTNGGNLGLEEPVGHNDFYPNGGKNMPGCSITEVGCSHGRSYEYFAYSIGNTRFQARQCSNLDQINNNQCSNLSQLHMGGASPKAARGLFLLTTNGSPPYYQ